MTCPVCRRQIKPLETSCVLCGYDWDERQEHCPARIAVGKELAKCELRFRHDGKHRATGVQVHDIEITVSWHWPTPDLNRSADYRRRHVGR